MSIWAVNWALHSEVPNATHKLVLIALANFADDQDEAWPHVATLAELASTSPRTVHRALEGLEADGLLVRNMGLTVGGRGGLVRSNSIYRLLLPETVTRRKGAGVSQPGVVRKLDGQDRCDMGVTTIPAPGEGPCQDRCDTGDATIPFPGEAAASNRCDMGVTTIPGSGERPCQDRCDTGVVTMNRCDTGDANRSATGDIAYKEEPSGLTTNPTPLPPTTTAGPVAGSGSVGSGDEPNRHSEAGDGGVDAVGPSVEDWDLLRRCLPEGMQALDGPSALRVAQLLRERLTAGWNPRMLHSILVGNTLPPNVRSLGGLVLHRVGQIPLGGAPRQPRPATAPIEEPVEPPEFWAAWLVERTKARLAGDPSAEQNRVWWIRRFPGPSHIPGRVDLEDFLRQELATADDSNTNGSTALAV